MMLPGRKYPRPCVRTVWSRMRKPGWVPIIGPVHDDAEIIGFEPKHWHVDFRFLPRNMRRKTPGGRGIHEVFFMPVSSVWPEGDSRGDSGGEGKGTMRPGMGIRVDDLPDPRYPVESYLRILNRTFHEHYPGYPDELRWMKRLEEAHRDSELLPGPVCPHRLAPLGGIEEDEDSCVTCPMHGLRWNLRTGRLAPWGGGQS